MHIASGTSHPLRLYPGVLGRHETAGGLKWLLMFSNCWRKNRSNFFFIYFYLILAFLLIHQFFPQWLPCAIPSKLHLYCFSLITHCGVEWHSGGTDPPCNALPDLGGWHRGKPGAQRFSFLLPAKLLFQPPPCTAVPGGTGSASERGMVKKNNFQLCSFMLLKLVLLTFDLWFGIIPPWCLPSTYWEWQRGNP